MTGVAARGIAAALLLGALSGCEAVSSNGGLCEMREVAELTVLTASGVPVVPARVNGHDVAFVVDTGALISAIDPNAIRAFGLPVGINAVVPLAGVGGGVRARLALVHHLSIGGAEARNVRFAALYRSGGAVDGRPVIGLWGADFLSNYDVELDLPDRRIGLYVPSGGCGSDFTPWDVPADPVPISLDDDLHVQVPARLDGRAITALLDTGASWTMIPRSVARALGVSAADLGADRSGFIVGLGVVKARIHAFRSLQIGNDRMSPLYAAVSDWPMPIVGESWLRNHRRWLSYQNRVLLIAAQPATH